MLFNSVQYALFLGIVLLVYYRLAHKWQNLFLLVASYAFYSFWDARYLFLLLALTVTVFLAGRSLAAARARQDQFCSRLFLLVGVLVSLVILALFKYFGFFVSSAATLLGAIGFQVSAPVLNVLLPVGISFYTFRALSYIVDIYRGHLEPASCFTDFALYVSFFPQLAAGPIERPGSLLPQITSPRVVTQDHWNRGIYLILVGLVRKIVIGDLAGAVADPYFSSPQSYTSL